MYREPTRIEDLNKTIINPKNKERLSTVYKVEE